MGRAQEEVAVCGLLPLCKQRVKEHHQMTPSNEHTHPHTLTPSHPHTSTLCLAAPGCSCESCDKRLRSTKNAGAATHRLSSRRPPRRCVCSSASLPPSACLSPSWRSLPCAVSQTCIQLIGTRIPVFAPLQSEEGIKIHYLEKQLKELHEQNVRFPFLVLTTTFTERSTEAERNKELRRGRERRKYTHTHTHTCCLGSAVLCLRR